MLPGWEVSCVNWAYSRAAPGQGAASRPEVRGQRRREPDHPAGAAARHVASSNTRTRGTETQRAGPAQRYHRENFVEHLASQIQVITAGRGNTKSGPV